MLSGLHSHVALPVKGSAHLYQVRFWFPAPLAFGSCFLFYLWPVHHIKPSKHIFYLCVFFQLKDKQLKTSTSRKWSAGVLRPATEISKRPGVHWSESPFSSGHRLPSHLYMVAVLTSDGGGEEEAAAANKPTHNQCNYARHVWPLELPSLPLQLVVKLWN